ncbi:hypothetical protein ACFFNY_09640 [Paenibacillus hodogayensis]|uniref:DUF4878 domain-containing protein n=1 Tax=Paenibacillus hodogayensis TaxID=279208 RepID=A0ABV5VU98_9BACL
MRSKMLGSIVATVMSCCFVFTGITNTANASAQSERALVEQTVNNYYKSIESKDSLLFLESIADSDRAAYQAKAKSLEGTKTNYDIVNIKKIQASKYEVYIAELSSPDGKELPVIPYDVVLVDGQWKLDRSTVGIFPKEELKKITDSGYVALSDSAFFKTVVSENDNFYIRKDPQKSGEISLRDWRTYDFGTQSVDIYSPGVLGVTSMPGPNTGPNNSTNWVIAICKDALTGLESSTTLDGFVEDSYNFEVDGYHNINVYNFNYPDQPGKYNVVW